MRCRICLAASLMLVVLCGAGCQGPESALGEIRLAHLQGATAAGLDSLKHQYEDANPGTSLRWHPSATHLASTDRDRVIFVHGKDTQGRPQGRFHLPSPCDFTVGDLVLLRAGQTLETDGTTVDLLAFSLKKSLPTELPLHIRPDNDPAISDTPGGCATDADAYRRVALTWLPEKGPYVYHGLNAHRVLITDSFTHYHPADTGWDEFYLVQDVRDGGGIWVSRQTDRITDPASVDAGQAKDLLRWLPLETGDLVLLPRGTVHRGFGGVLVHVLAVPGFVPDNEIPVDDDLRAINERLGLKGAALLPCHNCGG